MNLTLRELFERYGPTLAVIAILALLVVAMPGNDDDGDGELSTGEPTEVATGAEEGFEAGTPGAAAAPAEGGFAPGGGTSGAATAGGGSTGGGGGSAAVSGAAGGGSAAAGGPSGATATTAPPPANTKCRDDGRMPGFNFVMPPCVATFSGDNGGATARGVSRDRIVVARHICQLDPATKAVLFGLGADDSRGIWDQVDAALVHYFNNHIETYGRQVHVVTVEASGDDDDERAMRADAIRIAEEVKAFAAWYVAPCGPAPAFTQELAARGVICICTISLGRTFYKPVQGRVFSALPVLEEFYAHLAEYIGKRLANRPAKWAGLVPPTLRTENRKFGVIYFQGQAQRIDPWHRDALEFFKRELARYGVSLTHAVGYQFDIPRNQEQATNVVVQMKEKGVSTLLFMGEPLFPIFLTKEATRQQYFPEWLMSGTLLTDTTFFGRANDQAQWEHAFGMSPLWVFFRDVSTSYGYKAFYHSRPDLAQGNRRCGNEPCEGVGINVRYEPLQELFLGIQMAGPKLTAETFAQGMYKFPRIGGIPKVPLSYFTPDSPTRIKDFTEVFWDPQGTGKDETGKDGVGILLKVANGKRYALGQWPRSEPNVFTREGTVFTSDTPPESWPHDNDGHTHPATRRCRSCG